MFVCMYDMHGWVNGWVDRCEKGGKCMDEWRYEWVGEWMDSGMDGWSVWVDEWIYDNIDGWMDRLMMNEWVGDWMDGWKDGEMDG